MESLNEALIAAVEKRSALYDKSDENYTNRPYISKLWDEISDEVGIPCHNARKKWTMLRDYFQKSLRQLTSKTGRKWYLHDSLLFLRPHLSDKKNCSYLSDDSEKEELSTGSHSHVSSWLANVSTSAHEMDDTQFQPKDNICDVKTVSAPVPVSTSISSSAPVPVSAPMPVSDSVSFAVPVPMSIPDSAMPTSPPSSTPTRIDWRTEPSPIVKKRKLQHTQKTLLNPEIVLVKETIKAMRNTEDLHDEDNLFLLSLAPKLKMLDPLSKLECQAEMQLLVLRFMRRVMNGNAQSTNPGKSTEEKDHDVIHIVKAELE